MTINLDNFMPEQGATDKITEQVQNINRSHGQIYPKNYALSWIMANQVIQRYYARLGLDAIPVWRDSFGWSQFNLTRATNCLQPINKAEESQRYIVFDAIAVNWKKQGASSESQVDVYNNITIQHRPPVVAVEEGVAQLSLEEQEPFDHAACLHGPHAYAYTKLFQVVTDLICLAPELVAKREMNLDLNAFGQVRDDNVHALRQLGMAQPGITRDWFEMFHVPANTYVYINVFTGDLAVVEGHGTAKSLDYPGWNELNEEQLTAYFAQMLQIPRPE